MIQMFYVKHRKVDKMKKYLVESRNGYKECFGNYYGYYIYAIDMVTAAEIYVDYTGIEWFDIKVTDVETGEFDIY